MGGESLSGSLYVVATPIGNLRDISLRALDILREVDLIACEDTRVSAKLLQHYGIRKELISLYTHNESRRTQQLLGMLQAGKRIALISDAGTPTISDPGAALVDAARDGGYAVIALPGPNAAVTALSASGFDSSHFLFYGFLPQKKAERRAALAEIAALPYALVFYEAPHRVVASLADMAEAFGPTRRVAIARELTKMFETQVRMPLGEAGAWLAQDDNHTRGEFVLIVEAAAHRAQDPADEREAKRMLKILLEDLPLKQAVALAQRISGLKRNMLYDAALKMASDTDATDPA